MRTSHLYVLLLSALVVQISSETVNLQYRLDSLLLTALDVVARPLVDITESIKEEVLAKPDAEQFLKEFSRKLKRLMEQTQDELFNMIPKDKRENTKKAIGYLSMYMSEALPNAYRVVTKVLIKSFEELPDNIKTKLLDIRNDIEDFLKKITIDLSDPKTSQKTSEE